MAQSDCSAEIAEIDRRIETGNYPANNVQVARTMQQSMAQMCAMMDAGTRASMMEGIEDLLPTKSEEEREAERRARSAELKAAREARKAREAGEARAREARVSPVVRAPATGRRVAATLLNRGEVMYHTWTWDWDIHNGNLRVLYSSFPDRTQYGLPDWTFNVYVAEMSPGGEVTHRHIASRQRSDHTALALRRGYDELLFERGPGAPTGPSHLERWSIGERRLLSSVGVNDIAWNAGGKAWRIPTYQVATSDGNLLYAQTETDSPRDRRARLAWFKVSPEGRVVGSNVYDIPDSASPWSWMHTTNGGGGLVVNVLPVDDAQLDSAMTIPDDRRSYRAMTANVSREKRVLLVNAHGNLAEAPTIIERELLELAPPNSPSPSTAAEIQAAVSGQFEWMGNLRADYDANRGTEYLDVGPRRVEMVRETPTGIAALTRVVADRDRKPPIHGIYIVEFERAAETRRLYLQPLEDDLEVDFRALAPAPGGGYYLFGFDHESPDSHVVRIDAKGNPVARSQLPTEGINIEGIEADPNGVWLYGHAYVGKEPARLYLERIDFD